MYNGNLIPRVHLSSQVSKDLNRRQNKRLLKYQNEFLLMVAVIVLSVKL